MPDMSYRESRVVTGAIPTGPVTAATEFVFVADQAFVNATKHEEAVGPIAAERDRLQAEVDGLNELREHYGHDALARATELLRWAESYGEPEEWCKRAQQAHGRAEARGIERDALRRDVDALLAAIETQRVAFGFTSIPELINTANTIRKRIAEPSTTPTTEG